MTLPKEISSIFSITQKSYKMVLIIALLDEMRTLGNSIVSLSRVRERFLAMLQEREASGRKVDQVPSSLGTSWRELTLQKVNNIIDTPMSALSFILEWNIEEQTIGFKHELYTTWTKDTLEELYHFAIDSLERYYDQPEVSISLRSIMQTIMSSYINAKLEPFAGHSLGAFVRRSVPEQLHMLPFIDSNLKIQGSVGQGNWATIPWVALMDKRITGTTQKGEYIVYLFSEDMSSVYVTLNQGVTFPQNQFGRTEGRQYLQKKVQEIRRLLPFEGAVKDSNIKLSSGGLGQDYEISTIAYYHYEIDNLPSDEKLIQDLQNLVENYKLYVEHELKQRDKVDPAYVQQEDEEAKHLIEDHLVKQQLNEIKQYIRSKGFSYPSNLIENFYLSLKSKPFVILAGVSGTGKTKLVKLFAEALGATTVNQQFNLIPVRSDWSDPSDLIGYRDLSGIFRPGKLTDVLVIASHPDNRAKPYFVCLDEMNLARVEHYFSDLLSILETQEWKADGIITDSLLSEGMLHTEEDCKKYGNIHLPDNVYLIGTVNMDETTHPFSKKVLDRANTIEFNYIDLLQFPDLTLMEIPSVMKWPNRALRMDYIHLTDAYSEYESLIKETTELLVKVNRTLEAIHSHIGFRIRDAVSFYMIYNERFQLMSKDEAFDLQLLQKILPRIQGSNYSVKRVLLSLLELTLDRRLAIEQLVDDSSELYEIFNAEEAKYPLSSQKLIFMLRRLEEDGFTSYWIS